MDRVFDCLEKLKKQPPKLAALPAVKSFPAPPIEGRKMAGNASRVPEMLAVSEAPGIPLYEPANLQAETLSSEEFIQPIYARRIQEKFGVSLSKRRRCARRCWYGAWC